MKANIYQTDEEDLECMDLDGEGAVIYGTQSYNGESPTSDDVFQHVKGCKEKGKTWWWQCVRVVLVSLRGTLKSSASYSASAATHSSAPPTPPMPARHT